MIAHSLDHSQSSCDYSIIIPAYNEEKFLPETLVSLRRASVEISFLDGEIIVVDNNSTDRTAQIAHDFGCKVVSETVHQIAKVRNTGANYARGNYLFFVDADTIVPKLTFRHAIEGLESGKVGCGGACLSFDQDHGRWISGRVLPALWNLISVKFQLFAGSFIFCRSELFFSCGGFPETHFAGEEIVLSRNLKKECRKNNKSILILSDYPVISSARKLLWYNDWTMFRMILPLVIFPIFLRFQKSCRFWYYRPTKN